MVATYIYEIEGKEFHTTAPIVRHVFSVAGVYTVKLKVVDNNGVTSPGVSVKFTVL
jgi:PKD repeat protein